MNHIKQIRKLKGIKQKDLAVIVGCNIGYMCDVENGKKNPSFNMLKRIADALDVNILELKGISNNC